MHAGKPRQRAGRRRGAAKRSPEAVRAALDAAMSMYSLSSFKLFYDSVLHTKALLAWNRDTAVLAFRGTASLTNAWSDLQVLGLMSSVHVNCPQHQKPVAGDSYRARAWGNTHCLAGLWQAQPLHGFCRTVQVCAFC